MANPRVQPSLRGMSAGSFPEQRLVIEPTDDAVDRRKLRSQFLISNSSFRPHSNFYIVIKYSSVVYNIPHSYQN